MEEKAELDKKIDLTEDQKKIESAFFEKVLVAVDEVLPAVLDLIPIPELPKAVKRWFSLMPCSMASIGLFASENLVSLADGMKTVEAVAEKVADAVPALKPLVKEAEKVVEASVATVVAAVAVAQEAQAQAQAQVQGQAQPMFSLTSPSENLVFSTGETVERSSREPTNENKKNKKKLKNE